MIGIPRGPSWPVMGIPLPLPTNDINEEIERIIHNAHKAYFGLLRHFKSRLFTRKTKCNLYKTLVKPVLIYGSETWTLSKTNMAICED